MNANSRVFFTKTVHIDKEDLFGIVYLDMRYLGCFDSTAPAGDKIFLEAPTVVQTATACIDHCASQTPVSCKQKRKCLTCLSMNLLILLYMERLTSVTCRHNRNVKIIPTTPPTHNYLL